MLIRTVILFVALTIFSSAAAVAAPKTGCQKFNFVGTFLSPNEIDVFGDGNPRDFAFQLTIHSDGTVDQYWTGLPDYLINAGTGSPQIGSWTCRSDGKLIITWLQASYFPVYPVANDPNLTSQDVKLSRHSRTTYMFSVDDDNTVTRQQSRTRSYTPTEDPTDAAGGTLGSVNTSVVTYKRLAASDADLLVP